MIHSADEFVELRTSKNPDRYRRAAIDSAPDHVWLEVIERYPDMRKWVAHNKTVPAHILRLLASDPDRDVRVTVAAVRRVEPSVLETLAKDPDEGVRRAVVFNAKAPEGALRILVHDNWDLIAKKANERLHGH
jgi:hypothetical protein